MRNVAKKGLLTAVATGSVLASTAGYAYASAEAHGGAVNSPGVGSGNSVQVPVDVPINACGNTVDVIGLLNPSYGNRCANVDAGTHGNGATGGESSGRPGSGDDAPGRSWPGGGSDHAGSDHSGSDHSGSDQGGGHAGHDGAEHKAPGGPGQGASRGPRPRASPPARRACSPATRRRPRWTSR